VVFVLPSPCCIPKRAPLLATLDFIARNFIKEGTPASLADKLINVGHHVNRQYDVRPFGYGPRHTLSVT
jgi:hypothetical protein